MQQVRHGREQFIHTHLASSVRGLAPRWFFQCPLRRAVRRLLALSVFHHAPIRGRRVALALSLSDSRLRGGLRIKRAKSSNATVGIFALQTPRARVLNLTTKLGQAFDRAFNLCYLLRPFAKSRRKVSNTDAVQACQAEGKSCLCSLAKEEPTA